MIVTNAGAQAHIDPISSLNRKAFVSTEQKAAGTKR